MSEAKHTPGPWVVRTDLDNAPDDASVKDGIQFASIIGEDGEGSHIARVWNDVRGASANANLIAAAPDLLEILKPFIEIWDRGGADYEKRMRDYWGYNNLSTARAAIAKATSP